MGRMRFPLAVGAILALFLISGLFLSASPAQSGTDTSQLAMFDVDTGVWHLRYEPGVVDTFYYGIGGDLPLIGDWDCDGFDTVAMFRPSNGFIYLRNSNTFGVADHEFFYGIGGDIPLAGDWNADGCDTFAIYRQSEGKVYVSNRLGTHPAEFSFYYGIPGDRPFSGDFNGDGVETIGLYRDTTGYAYIRDSLSSGVADYDFYYGEPSDRILTGDWNGDGNASVAIFRPSDQTFYLSYDNRQGFADEEVAFGDSGWIPLAGVFEPSPAIAARSVVLDGVGIPKAANYAGPAPHTVVLLKTDGEVHAWDDDMPGSWHANDVESLQLVAEVDSADSLYKIETCTYTPFGTINRWGYERSGILFEARSAQRVASRDVSGSRPSSCPFSHSFDMNNLTENWYGQAVEVSDIRSWLYRYVEEDLETPTTTTTSTSTTSTTSTSTTSTTTSTTTTTTTAAPSGEPADACDIGSAKSGVNVTNARAFVDTDAVS
ncbi:MAG: hypothetical protein KJO36_03180, partial [Acidimicrobiia bacterium]|nr:hypothetical protein [Acidimicrobiia bacterium]